MKILSLSISNIMKITAAFIQFKSEVTTVQGENEQGKSSLLDSLVMAFGGDRVLPEMPVKKGAKKGEIVVKMAGDKNLGIPPFTITRTITDKKASVKIEPEIAKAGETPRSFLDKLIGSISFDPLKFINEDSKKQRKTLLTLIGIDPDEWDKKEKEAFDKRTEIGRELKTAEAKVKDKVIYEDIEETEEIKVGDLTAKLQKAIALNQELTNRVEANERLKQSAIAGKKTIEELKAKVAAMEATLADAREKYKAEKDDLALTFPEDIDAINAEIQSIESKNSKIRHNKQVALELAEKTTKQALYDAVDTELESIRADRLKLILEANMPIPGLTVDDDGILYNDIPLSQCSDGAKLMIGVAISMALNPTVRIILIKDGSLLGPKNMAMLEKVIKDKDFQLLIERVADIDQYNATGKVGIFIEEGQIQFIDGVAPKNETTSILAKMKDEKVKVKPVDDSW